MAKVSNSLLVYVLTQRWGTLFKTEILVVPKIHRIQLDFRFPKIKIKGNHMKNSINYNAKDYAEDICTSTNDELIDYRYQIQHELTRMNSHKKDRLLRELLYLVNDELFIRALRKESCGEDECGEDE